MIEPTVTISLAELVRLQGYERRAKSCRLIFDHEARTTDEQRAETRARIKSGCPEYEPPSAEEEAIGKRLDRYAWQFVASILDERS